MPHVAMSRPILGPLTPSRNSDYRGGMRRRGFGAAFATAFAAAGAAAVWSAAPAQAGVAKPAPGPESTPVGYDVSWPQCGDTPPSGQAFAVVGVTGGLANNTNPCFAEQLAWARTSVGGAGQPPAALYVNTANPGLRGSWWPTSNSYREVLVDNPYGTCTGEVDAACAYVYGWAKAYDNVADRGVPEPSSYLWWLDVETENTWQDDQDANRADLEGMTAYLESIGARVGLYSVGDQCDAIVGIVPPASNLYDLPSWLAGAHTLWGALSACSLPPLTEGGRVTLTQYVADELDHNYSCVSPAASAPPEREAADSAGGSEHGHERPGGQ